MCVQELGFNLHAATRAGALDDAGREGLIKYVLRPPIGNKHLQPGPEGLVRTALKKPFSDGTFVIDLDPLSLLCRLCASVPAARIPMISSRLRDKPGFARPVLPRRVSRRLAESSQRRICHP
jgi:hypothetical protein